MEPAVSTSGLSVTFRRGWRRTPVAALRDLELTAAAGEIVGVLGPNGSGKSTLLAVLAGVQRPSAGHARVLGTAPTSRTLTGRVGYQPEGPLPFANLSAETFLTLTGTLMGFDRRTAQMHATTHLDQLGLSAVADRRHGTFSTGMRRRLALAAALMATPEVLLLDEPTSGLDPDGSLMVRDLIRARVDGGATALIASHDLQEIEQLCDRVYVLHGGECRASGALDALLATGARELVVRGLTDAAMPTVEHAIAGAGGELVEVRAERRHLYSLYRRLAAGEPVAGERAPDREPEQR